MSTTSPTALKDGKVVAIAGPVIDVEFPRGSLPELNQALEFTITSDGKDVKVLAEVAQQLGNSRVRVVCMKPTDGLRRGTPVRNTGHGIQVPVGDKTFAVQLQTLQLSSQAVACLKPELRSSTCSPRTSLVEKSACSVVQV